MEILDKFNIELLKIMGVDADYPEPQQIQVFLNDDEICWIENAKDIRSFSMRKANVLREAFRGCRSTWKFEIINGWAFRFSINAPMRAKRKWDKIENKIQAIQQEENDFSRISIGERKAKEEYGKRLLRRIKKVIFDPAEQEDAFRLNMKRASTSPYNFGSLENLKKMVPIYEMGGYSALGRNEYWWSDAIDIVRERPNIDWVSLVKLIKFRKNHPEWYESFAFRPDAMAYIEKFARAFKEKEGREAPIYVNDVQAYNRACDILAQPSEVIKKIPVWAQLQILESDESPTYWSFPEEEPKNQRVGYLSAEKGAIDAIRQYTGIVDLPKKIAGRIFAEIMNDDADCDKLIRKESGVTYEIVRWLPRNWKNWSLFQWLGKKGSNSAMTKEHIVHGPAGRTMSFTYMEKLDELHAEDLVNGLNTKPDIAFERAARRIAEKAKLSMGENIKFSPAPFKAAKGIRQLMDSNSLKEEGKKMENCVVGYAGACLRKATYVFHVATKDGEATMEVTAERKMLQLYAKGNSEPSDSVKRLAFAWAKENNIDVHDCNRRN